MSTGNPVPMVGPRDPVSETVSPGSNRPNPVFHRGGVWAPRRSPTASAAAGIPPSVGHAPAPLSPLGPFPNQHHPNAPGPPARPWSEDRAAHQDRGEGQRRESRDVSSSRRLPAPLRYRRGHLERF